MPTLKLTVQADLDGVPLSGFPLVRRLSVAEVQSFETAHAAGGFASLPLSALSTVTALVLSSNQPVTLRVDGQADKGIDLKAGGLVILFDVLLDAGPTLNATVSAATTATLAGMAGGA